MEAPNAFAALCGDAQACRVCPAMDGRRRVLSPLNGRVPAAVMVVAEAPGRFGGERTGIPLTADQAGRNFLGLLHHVGWRREDLFVTNAVLCNPQRNGFNRPPTAAELRNCRPLLARTIEAVRPRLVIALGAVALESLRRLGPHTATLADAGTLVGWNGRHLAPLYHPGAQARIHRPKAQQEADFAAVARAFASVPAV